MIVLDTHALLWWALMTNHLHLLVRTGIVPLAKLMQRVLSPYAQGFNVRTQRVGHLVQQRYRAVPVQSTLHLQAEIRYITLNPLRAGIVHTVDALLAHPWTAFASLRDPVGRPPLDDETLGSVYGPDRAAMAVRIEEMVRAGAARNVQGSGALTLVEERERLGVDDRALQHLAKLGQELGMSAAEIGRVLGVHRSTVLRASRNKGV